MHFKVPHFRHVMSPKVRVGVAIAFFTGAFLLTSGIFTKVYSQEKERKPKGGDSTLLMQTDSTTAPVAQKDTAKVAQPQMTVKEALTLTHYVPFFLRDLSSPEVKLRAIDKNMKSTYAEGWARMEDTFVPFGLSKEDYEKCPAAQRAVIDANWKEALKEIHIYLMSDKGGIIITPDSSNIKALHTPKEIEQLLGYWDFLKSNTGKGFWNPPVR